MFRTATDDYLITCAEPNLAYFEDLAGRRRVQFEDVSETHAVLAIQAGKPVILPTDTVYGLCATPYREEPTRRIYRLKGRRETMPSSIHARLRFRPARW